MRLAARTAARRDARPKSAAVATVLAVVLLAALGPARAADVAASPPPSARSLSVPKPPPKPTAQPPKTVLVDANRRGWMLNPYLSYVVPTPLTEEDIPLPLANSAPYEALFEGLETPPLEACRMRDAVINESLPCVGFTSFPRAGNTYMRYVLEKATGFRTGAVHNDGGLIHMGFKGEGRITGVVVAKSHEPHLFGFTQLSLVTQKSIFVARDPFDSIVSFFEFRKTGTHTVELRLQVIPGKPMWEEFQRFALSVGPEVGRHFLWWRFFYQKRHGVSTPVDTEALKTISTLRYPPAEVAFPAVGSLTMLWVRAEDVFNSSRREATFAAMIHFAGLDPAPLAPRIRCAFEHQEDALYSKVHRSKTSECTSAAGTEECLASIAHSACRPTRLPSGIASYACSSNYMCNPKVIECVRRDCVLQYFEPAVLRGLLRDAATRSQMIQFRYRPTLLALSRVGADTTVSPDPAIRVSC